MEKSIMCGMWRGSTGNIEVSCIYHGISRQQAIINFIQQYFNNNYNTWNYPNTIEGIYKSNFIKDRILYNYSDDIVIYAQYN